VSAGERGTQIVLVRRGVRVSAGRGYCRSGLAGALPGDLGLGMLCERVAVAAVWRGCQWADLGNFLYSGSDPGADAAGAGGRVGDLLGDGRLAGPEGAWAVLWLGA
jgi:hypothetical protein